MVNGDVVRDESNRIFNFGNSNRYRIDFPWIQTWIIQGPWTRDPILTDFPQIARVDKISLTFDACV